MDMTDTGTGDQMLTTCHMRYVVFPQNYIFPRSNQLHAYVDTILLLMVGQTGTA